MRKNNLKKIIFGKNNNGPLWQRPVIFATLLSIPILTLFILALTIDFSDLTPLTLGLTIGTVLSTLLLLLSKYHGRLSDRFQNILEDIGILEPNPHVTTLTNNSRRHHNNHHSHN